MKKQFFKIHKNETTEEFSERITKNINSDLIENANAFAEAHNAQPLGLVFTVGEDSPQEMADKTLAALSN